jgi:hypothetical protein
MELRQHLIQWERSRPDWVVAAVAGFAAGAVLMVLDLLWSAAVDSGGPWRTSHMIAPIFTGADAARSSNYDFSVGVVAIALAVHYALGIVFGLILAAIMTPLHLDSTLEKAILTGAVFGVALYLVNFYGLVRLLPWLAELRGWPTIAAHLVFGIVAAVLYAKLGRAAPAGSRTAG